MSISGGSEDDLSGNLLHALEGLPEFAFVGDGLLDRGKLGPTKADGDRFPGDLASPLISASPGSGRRSL